MHRATFAMFLTAALSLPNSAIAQSNSIRAEGGYVLFNCSKQYRFLQIFNGFGHPRAELYDHFPEDILFFLHEHPIAEMNDHVVRKCNISNFFHERVFTMHSTARWTTSSSDSDCADAKNERLEIQINGKRLAEFGAGCEFKNARFRLDYFGDSLTVCQREGDEVIHWSPDCEHEQNQFWEIAVDPKLPRLLSEMYPPSLRSLIWESSGAPKSSPGVR